jgi:hypothetical protein
MRKNKFKFKRNWFGSQVLMIFFRSARDPAGNWEHGWRRATQRN